MRLIDADKLKEAIKEIGCDRFESWDKMLTLAEYETFVGDVIDNAPTVTGIINAKDFKKRLNNMEYVYLQDSYEDVIDAIDCEVTYFKEKMNHGKE